MILQISASSMTAQVTIDKAFVITEAAMIWRMFIGQSLSNLTNWLKTLGDGEVFTFILMDDGLHVPVKSKSQMRRMMHVNKAATR